MLSRKLYPLCSRDQEKSDPQAYRVILPFGVAKDHGMSWGTALTPDWKGWTACPWYYPLPLISKISLYHRGASGDMQEPLPSWLAGNCLLYSTIRCVPVIFWQSNVPAWLA